MGKNDVEANAQNSELDPMKHPSGARIEKMVSNDKVKGEKGTYGETLRPSEREPSYVPTQDTAEGNPEQTSDQGHRTTPETRES